MCVFARAPEETILTQSNIPESCEGLKEGMVVFLKGDFKVHVLKQTMDEEREGKLVKATKLLLHNLQKV